MLSFIKGLELASLTEATDVDPNQAEPSPSQDAMRAWSNLSNNLDHSRRGMDDYRAGHRQGRSDQERRKILFGPGKRAPVRLFRACEIVEDADRRHGVIRRIDHVIGHEAFDIADDRDGALLDPARQFLGRSGPCRGLTDGGIHEILLRLHKSGAAFAPLASSYAIARNRSTP